MSAPKAANKKTQTMVHGRTEIGGGKEVKAAGHGSKTLFVFVDNQRFFLQVFAHVKGR